MALACLTPRAARAQGISGQVYDDARSVIEELITKNVVESAVPIIACRAPELVPYYSKTFLTIHGRRFANLRQVLSDETSAAVAHVVSKMLRGEPLIRNVKTERSDLTVKLVPTSDNDTVKNTAELEKCYDDAKAQLSGRSFPDSPFEQAIKVDITCAADWSQPSSRYACEVGIATSMALQGKFETAEEHLRRAGATVLTEFLVAKVKEVTVGGQPRTLAGAEETLFEQVVVTLKDAGTNVDVALTDKLAAAMLRVVAPAEDAAAARDQLKGDLAKRFSALNRLPTQWRAAMGDGHLDPFAFLSLVAGSSGVLRHLCTPTAQPAPAQPAPAQPAPAQPAPAQPAPAQPAPAQPAPAQLGVCGAVNRGAAPEVWRDLSPILQAAVRRDYASLALGVIHPLFPQTPECKADPKSDECTQSTVYARFTENIASYVLEAVDSGEPSVATRAALKSAAVDLLDELGQRKGSGIDRGFGWKIVAPELALRYGWSSSFLNEATGNGARFYASVDWLTFRARLHYGEYAYVAAQLSLADLIGPFSEIALRKNVNTGYDRDEEVWLNFIRPRLDVLYGVPAFSRRLTLASSFAVRAASPYAKSDETYTYTPIWKDLTGETNMKSYWSRFFEFGFAIKYVL
ncbi:hypothetical protein [Sorangium sp. So ce388]|uniref:hypothetical protein n=1 Tax=Sorangium sp. So ce388 TaxID=3133309 RepID=UPI003F5C6309